MQNDPICTTAAWGLRSGLDGSAQYTQLTSRFILAPGDNILIGGGIHDFFIQDGPPPMCVVVNRNCQFQLYM